ncbi:MAG: PQQ-binding-like beta-propeller repeat protein [Pelagibacteraceae bacterium]
MNNLILIIFFLFLLTNCSFDKKTGIWKDSSEINQKTSIELENPKLENIFFQEESYLEEKNIDSDTDVIINKVFSNTDWNNEHYSLTNNYSNISYFGKKNYIFKSSKLAKFRGNYILKPLFYKNNLISYDNKGSIYLYSLDREEKVFTYNFYKGNYKKYKKKLFLSLSNETLYVADNLGYIYALDLTNKSIVWAKNFGIPFRSNLISVDNQVFISNQDNKIFSLDKFTGEINWNFPTSESLLKSEFKNNIIVDKIKKNVFFLNNSGELYSINYLSQKVNWVLNFKSSSMNKEIFQSSFLTLKNNRLIVSNGKSILNFDASTGQRLWSKPIPTKITGVLTDNYYFIVTKNNFLICLDISDGSIIWSKNINNEIFNFYDKNKDFDKIINLSIANNKLILFTISGYLMEFNYKNGEMTFFEKILKSGIYSYPIFVDNYLYLLNKNYKLYQFE